MKTFFIRFCKTTVVVFFCLTANFAQSEESLSPLSLSPSSREIKNTPIFWAIIPNPNDYTLFANGGWDGNWIVGYDSAWVVKLSSPPASAGIIRAFIGARLGRAKVESEINAEGKATGWKKPVSGDISIAISNKPVWSKSDVFLLTRTEDIPVEGDSQIPLEETGESRWFWVEVPLAKINFSGDNYLVVWSPSANLINNCPIIAGGWEIFPTARAWMVGANQEAPHAWIANGFAGKIPQELKTPISVYSPAVAMKLIPDHLPILKVNLETVIPDPKIPHKYVFSACVEGEDVVGACLEISLDNKRWHKYGRIIQQSPFVFTLRGETLPVKNTKQDIYVRIRAVNWWEDTAYSQIVRLTVETPKP